MYRVSIGQSYELHVSRPVRVEDISLAVGVVVVAAGAITDVDV